MKFLFKHYFLAGLFLVIIPIAGYSLLSLDAQDPSRDLFQTAGVTSNQSL